jgi:hypothetical protein
MNKKPIEIRESNFRKIVSNAVTRLLKEAYAIPNNIDMNNDERTGLIPYVVQMAKLYRDFSQQIDKLYDQAYAYYSTSNNFANDSLDDNERQFKQYFWEKFDTMFQSVSEKMEDATNELFALENEIEESINQHGINTEAEYDPRYGGNPKGAYRDYYQHVTNR